MKHALSCRFCATPLEQTFVNLGLSPLSNAYVSAEALQRGEHYFPLHVYVCTACYLVQLPEFESPENIFSDYAYFSSYSDSWLAHARQYAEQITPALNLSGDSLVVEIASNDGYLLQYFQALGVPVLGIEPAQNIARAAEEKGIPTLNRFFGLCLARELAPDHRADLLIGNNVLAHVPDLNDFVAGLPVLLKTGGLITLEFPHLLRLMEFNQFDTIYHEHFSYFSLLTVQRVFARHGLQIFHAETLPTHGGSLRIHAGHAQLVRPLSPELQAILAEEQRAGLGQISAYRSFAARTVALKGQLLSFLISAAQAGKTVAAYGAPAKGNTLLNYCGIGPELIAYTVDRNPHKQGRFLPGSRLPIFAPEKLQETRPDYVLILPWNLQDEIMAQMAQIRDWGGQFVIPVPEVRVLP